GKPIAIKGSGTDLRSDCYVSDAIEACFRIILAGREGEAYNVGSDLEEYTIKEMAAMLHQICGIQEPPTCSAGSQPAYIKSAPRRFCPDISKLKKELDYKPKIKIRAGLARTVEWNLWSK
ncbi:MAG: NAD-dependent epimerase/dehydratase family protein, partial [bacterium]